jgi:protein-disulfide isomerase
VTAPRAAPGAAAALLVAALAAGCSRAPAPGELQRTLEQHPEILAAAIRAHPEAIMDALNAAAGVAQTSAAERQRKEAMARIEAGFAHPFQPTIEHRAVLGNPAAPITVVEYTDFQCPYCLRERDVLRQVMEKYGDRVRLLVKQSPLDIHPHAMAAALMYEAIARQSPTLAYRFYDELYSNQEQLDRSGDAFLAVAAKRVGADVPRALADAHGSEVRATVEADLDEFQRFGFTGTPGLLVKGVPLQGAHPLASFDEIIGRQLAAIGQPGPSAAANPATAR